MKRFVVKFFFTLSMLDHRLWDVTSRKYYKSEFPGIVYFWHSGGSTPMLQC